jgi:UDP-galactopyranose mutase
MPFALNESTRFISPTKTPEYLAAGKPVISTPIQDVVRPYGEMNFVFIASTAEEFVAACDKALEENQTEKLARVDEFLAQNSWDKTWSKMANLIDDIVKKGTKVALA